MKVISLWQPWATLIALGEKQFETRSWLTNHRGLLAIHAARRMQEDQKELCLMDPFRSILQKHGIMDHALPLGAIVARVHVMDVFCTEDIVDRLSSQERAFGNYAPGRYAWKLHLVERILKPIPVRGAQGIFEVADELITRFL